MCTSHDNKQHNMEDGYEFNRKNLPVKFDYGKRSLGYRTSK